MHINQLRNVNNSIIFEPHTNSSFHNTKSVKIMLNFMVLTFNIPSENCITMDRKNVELHDALPGKGIDSNQGHWNKTSFRVQLELIVH